MMKGYWNDIFAINIVNYFKIVIIITHALS